MKTLIATCLLFLSASAFADCTTDVCTSFTLASHPLANGCQNVVTQDGASSWGAVCAKGFYNEGTLDIQLQHDPTNPGNSLFAPGCTSSVTSNTAPPYSSPTPQPAGSVVTAFTCQSSFYYWNGTSYTATWTGSYEVDYASVYQQHCSSGRGAHCVRGYYSVQVGGSGSMETAQPPAPPPLPPQPVQHDIALVANACTPAFDCILQPTDTSAVQVAVLFTSLGELAVQNTDGTVDTIPLDFISIVQQGDDQVGGGDPIPYTVTGGGEVYDPNTGALLKTDSFTLNVVQDPQGNVSLSGGTLTVVVQPQ